MIDWCDIFSVISLCVSCFSLGFVLRVPSRKLVKEKKNSEPTYPFSPTIGQIIADASPWKPLKGARSPNGRKHD